MTVEDYQTISDSIDTLESDRELLDCLGFLYTLSMECVHKMYLNLPKKRHYTPVKKTVRISKREAWYRLANYVASLKVLITNY